MPLFPKKSAPKRHFGFFSNFLSKEGLRSVRDDSNEVPSLKNESIGYVLLQVRDHTTGDIQHNLPLALDVILDNDGFVEGIMSSVASAVFTTQSKSMEQSIDALFGKLGSNVRVVYGHGYFLRGTVGSQRRFAYGTMFPNFGKMLEILLEIEFGSSKEL
jgi:hypothetical protein